MAHFLALWPMNATDVTNIEGLTICCSSCVANGVPEEHLNEILTLKKANAKISI